MAQTGEALAEDSGTKG